MRHQRGNKKLGKPTDQRLALLRSLAKSLFTHRRIETTDTRAKEVRKFAEKLITLAKSGSLHDRRQVLKVLPHKEIVKILFDEVAPKMIDRNGGFTRIIKSGYRRGDAAPLSIIELVE